MTQARRPPGETRRLLLHNAWREPLPVYPSKEITLVRHGVHQAKLGRVPRLVAADAGFYSAKNEAAAKAKGVKRVCHSQSLFQERRSQARAEEAMVP